MSKFLPLSVLLFSVAAVSANAQATDPNPSANTNDVFLDNHRPLIKHKDKAPTSRFVTGKVVDDTGQPLEGAIVTLTNTKTHERRQFITKNEGRFNFDEVSFTIDYELAAHYKQWISDTRKLSQYDHSAKVVRILTVAEDSPAPAAEAKKSNPPEAKK